MAVLDVIEADDRDVLGHPDPPVVAGAQRAEREQVVEREDRVRHQATGEQARHRACALQPVERGRVRDEGGIVGQPGLLEPFAVADQPQVGRLHAGGVLSPDRGHAAAAQPGEVEDGFPRRGDVVDGHMVGQPAAAALAEKHERRLVPALRKFALTGGQGREDQAVDEARPDGLEHQLLPVGSPFCLVDEHGEATAARRGHDLLCELADLLTGGSGGERVLQDLERANAFVVAVYALLRLGDTEGAEQAMAGLGEGDRDRGEMRIATALLRLAQDDPSAAAVVLAPVLDGSVPLAWPSGLIQAFLLEAIARDAAGHALERALDLAEPDGVLLPFLLHPAPGLLERHTRHRGAHASLIVEILSLLAGRKLASPAAGPRPPLEPLSESELRVLRYLPTNLTAPEIASELLGDQHVDVLAGVAGHGDAFQVAGQVILLA